MITREVVFAEFELAFAAGRPIVCQAGPGLVQIAARSDRRRAAARTPRRARCYAPAEGP